jgi:hypothetical protein
MKRFGLSVALSVLLAAPAAADPVVDFTSGGIASFTGEFTWGFGFNVSSSLTVGALGFWDEGGDGLAESHEVGLWNASGVLLAQVTVDNSSTPSASISGSGRWLFTALPGPLTLGAGDYLAGAYFPVTSPDALRQGTTGNALVITTIAGVTYLGPQRSPEPSGALAIPSLNQVSNGIPNGVFGPNLLEAEPVPSVPPSGLLILAALLCLTVAWHQRRRPATTR